MAVTGSALRLFAVWTSAFSFAACAGTGDGADDSASGGSSDPSNEDAPAPFGARELLFPPPGGDGKAPGRDGADDLLDGHEVSNDGNAPPMSPAGDLVTGNAPEDGDSSERVGGGEGDSSDERSPPPSGSADTSDALNEVSDLGEEGAIAGRLLRAFPGWRVCGADNCDASYAPPCEAESPCIRDQYVCAAVLMAWGAAMYSVQESSAAVADPGAASRDALSAMMDNLCSADELCSDAPIIVEPITCTTENQYPCPGWSCPN